MLLQQVAFGCAVAGIGHSLINFEVISPAGQFQAMVAKLMGFPGEVFQGQVGPLAGEERNGTAHY
jgi:hypothetical protein